MEFQRHPWDRLELANGLTVFFFDESKPIAEGRFQVRLLATVPIPLNPFSREKGGDPEGLHKVFCQEMAGTITFRAEKTRNFISEQDMPRILEEMKKDFLATNEAYLGHDAFAGKFMGKKFEEWKKGRQLKMLQEQMFEAGK